MFITLTQLKKMGACRSQLELFQETFGRRITVNPRNCLRAIQVGLDYQWFLSRFTGHDQRYSAYCVAFDKARIEYDAAFDRACDQANIEEDLESKRYYADNNPGDMTRHLDALTVICNRRDENMAPFKLEMDKAIAAAMCVAIKGEVICSS